MHGRLFSWPADQGSEGRAANEGAPEALGVASQEARQEAADPDDVRDEVHRDPDREVHPVLLRFCN